MKRRLLIDSEVLEVLDGISPALRNRLRRRMRDIRDAPERFSEYVEKDAAGRELDGHICEGYSILYWDDHADRHLKILEIRRADR